eukprot:CAMPEP_0197898850 /NCGR_PEP_ID=MMETSP1439-20131203/45020_1 /TAXON_ID=66791 /ORGANISM="Gonyaulax spinifera, Strain CCMP409" /LENGTH=42 /DNA_ID= /DNA_START= /DNA_END= /DNA_ORIENTATION=
MTQMHEDLEANYLWFETEVLMRNQVKMHMAVNHLKHDHGVEL